MIYLARVDGSIIGKFTESELLAKISTGDVSPDDKYLNEGTKEWLPISRYPGAGFPEEWAKTPTAKKKSKKQRTPLEIGVYCALIATFAPLLNEILFFFLSVPLLIAAFVLAIISMVHGKIAGGILLLVGTFFAFPASCVAMVDRQKILYHPAEYRQELERQRTELNRSR